jgi:hypothetical protein
MVKQRLRRLRNDVDCVVSKGLQMLCLRRLATQRFEKAVTPGSTAPLPLTQYHLPL